MSGSSNPGKQPIQSTSGSVNFQSGSKKANKKDEKTAQEERLANADRNEEKMRIIEKREKDARQAILDKEDEPLEESEDSHDEDDVQKPMPVLKKKGQLSDMDQEAEEAKLAELRVKNEATRLKPSKTVTEPAKGQGKTANSMSEELKLAMDNYEDGYVAPKKRVAKGAEEVESNE